MTLLRTLLALIAWIGLPGLAVGAFACRRGHEGDTSERFLAVALVAGLSVWLLGSELLVQADALREGPVVLIGLVLAVRLGGRARRPGPRRHHGRPRRQRARHAARRTAGRVARWAPTARSARLEPGLLRPADPLVLLAAGSGHGRRARGSGLVLRVGSSGSVPRRLRRLHGRHRRPRGRGRGPRVGARGGAERRGAHAHRRGHRALPPRAGVGSHAPGRGRCRPRVLRAGHLRLEVQLVPT